MLLQLLIVSVEIAKLIGKNICVWDKVKGSLPELLLHSNHVIAQPILPGDLIGLREVIDLLELVQSFIKIAFT